VLELLWTALYIAVLLFIVLMFVRLVLDYVQVFAREWRPRGVVLVLAEITYTVTDPPIKAVRRVIPPLNLGGLRLDLAFMVVMVVCWIVLGVLGALAAA
jgi:YggT family protein